MARRGKKLVVLLVTFVALGAVAVVVLVRSPGARNVVASAKAPAERWVGEQLKLIAQDLLRPTLAFDTFTYTFPGTVDIDKVRLIDGDVTFLEAEKVRITLRDVPKRGQPIVIDTIELTAPIVRIIVHDDGTLVGFNDFAKHEGTVKADGGSTRPSDVFAMRSVRVQSGAFRWTGLDGTMMELDDIAFELDGKPDAEPGWYGLDIDMSRPPLAVLKSKGRFDIDSALLDLSQLSLEIELNDKTLSYLPPSFQSRLKQHEARGHLKITGDMHLPLADSSASTFDLRTTLKDAHVAIGQGQIAVDHLEFDVAFAGNRLTASNLDAGVFGGRLQGSADLDFARDLGSVKVDAHDLRLERMFRETAAVKVKQSGRITINGTASASLDTFPQKLDGDGTISIDDAQLRAQALFGGLMNAIGRKGDGRDSGEATFRLRPDRLDLSKVTLVSGATAARGEGEILFDGRINFRFNGGPLERAQESLGVIGDALGAITDRVVTYHVTGTWSDPAFKARPLGIGASAEPLAAPDG